MNSLQIVPKGRSLTVSQRGRGLWFSLTAVLGLVAALMLGVAGPAAAAPEDTPPIRTIAGPNTGLSGPNPEQWGDGPRAVYALPDGTLVVADKPSNSVYFYEPGADGDAAPVRTLSGAETLISWPSGIEVLSDGSIAVTCITQDGFTGYVVIFDADADGNVAPIRTITSPGLRGAAGIVELADGSVAVANYGGGSVQVFASDADGMSVPIRTITVDGSFNPWGLGELADGSLAVANQTGPAVLVFAANADGLSTPLRAISGASTEFSFPTGLTVLSDGSIVVANLVDASLGFFASDDDGDVAPFRSIAGLNTAMAGANSVAELPDGTVAVANSTGGSVTVYPLDEPVDRGSFTPVEPYRAYDSRQNGGLLAAGESRMVATEVPAGALAVAYNLTATGMSGAGYLAVSPGDVPAGGTSTLNYSAPGQTVANAYVSGVDDAGQIMVTASGSSTQFIVDVVGYYMSVLTPPPVEDPGSGGVGGRGVQAANGDDLLESFFVPVVPTRAYDSRDIGAGGPLGVGEPRTVNVTAAGLVPPGATAVAYTLTQTQTTGSGFLAVGPAGAPQPDVSSINWYAAGQTSANSSMVAITDGLVQVWAGSPNDGGTQFVIDILGYFMPVPEAPWAGAFTPIDPQRAYDSRVDQPAGPIIGGQNFTTSMAVAGVAPDAVAVAYNLTLTGSQGAGVLTTMPGDVLSPPVASTINWWQSGQTLANGSVVQIPQFTNGVRSQGTLGLPVTTFAAGGSTQYVMDVAGYYTFAFN